MERTRGRHAELFLSGGAVHLSTAPERPVLSRRSDRAETPRESRKFGGQHYLKRTACVTSFRGVVPAA